MKFQILHLPDLIQLKLQIVQAILVEELLSTLGKIKDTNQYKLHISKLPHFQIFKLSHFQIILRNIPHKSSGFHIISGSEAERRKEDLVPAAPRWLSQGFLSSIFYRS